MFAILLLLQAQAPTIERLTPFTSHRLQAVSPVGRSVVWVSGTGGTWGVTADNGRTWKHGLVPGADSLEFRDVQGFDERRALLLAAGPGDRSRIYQTEDGGATWAQRFVNTEPDGFYDCFAFWDSTAGFAVSDAVRGVLPILVTTDGGRHWRLRDSLPAALKGEGAFAASGTCVATWGDSAAAIATGAAEQARVVRTDNRWATWRTVVTPIVQGSPTSGHTSIVLQPREIAVGGDVADTSSTAAHRVIVRRQDEGWRAGGAVTFRGPIYGVAAPPWPAGAAGFTPSLKLVNLRVAVGPGGASWSVDGGQSWMPLDSLSYWSVAIGGVETAWLVGPNGRITKAQLNHNWK